MKTKVWFIRHKPTGFYLPLPKGGGRGGSYVEPTDPTIEPPRVFFSERAAISALGMWLLGKFYENRAYASHESTSYDDVDRGVIPVPTRKREEMDIVGIEIELPGAVA